MLTFGLPRTFEEYERAAKFIRGFKIIKCCVCKKDFTWRRRDNHPPITCSKICHKEWHRLQNNLRQQRFRDKKKAK